MILLSLLNKVKYCVTQLIDYIYNRCDRNLEAIINLQKQNTKKIKELILYISEKCEDHKFFGMVKLNKILFATDFDRYTNTGSSVTGGRYTKQQQGPTLFSMVPILREMLKANEIKFKPESIYDKLQKRPIACRNPDMAYITDEEKQLVDNWIETMRPYTASQVRDWTHKFPFWKLLNIGDIIPYNSIYWRFTSSADITESDREDAKQILDKYGDQPISRPHH